MVDGFVSCFDCADRSDELSGGVMIGLYTESWRLEKVFKTPTRNSRWFALPIHPEAPLALWIC